MNSETKEKLKKFRTLYFYLDLFKSWHLKQKVYNRYYIYYAVRIASENSVTQTKRDIGKIKNDLETPSTSSTDL